MTKTGTIFWARDNKLITLSISFFLIWKLSLVYLLWQDRLVPPEPDDSYSYISTIASSGACKGSFFCNQYQNALVSDYSSYAQFSYKIILGAFTKIFSTSPETVYQISFYVGTIILAGVVFAFIKSLTKNAVIISLGVLFLAFCHGNGEVHGFFWVVPSFFSVALFFLITAILIAENFPKRFFYSLAIILTPIFILVHPTSIYFLSVVIIYTAMYLILRKTIDKALLIRSFFIIVIGAMTIYLQSSIMIWNGQDDPYGIVSVLPTATSIFSLPSNNHETRIISYDITASGIMREGIDPNTYLSKKVDTMRSAYFGWFFPHWTITALFLVILLLLYQNKQYKLLSLYVAAISFFTISTILNQFGFRAAILLWPMTYLVYAFGVYYISLLIWKLSTNNQIFRTMGMATISTGLLIFGLLNALYAITVNTNLNIRNNYAIDRKFERYLLENTSPHDTLFIERIIRQSVFGSELFFRNKIVPPQENPTYLVILEQSSYRTSVVNEGGRFLVNTALTLLGKQPLQTILKAEDKTPIIPSGYVLEKSFADISIYRYETT